MLLQDLDLLEQALLQEACVAKLSAAKLAPSWETPVLKVRATHLAASDQ
jgi:hypothetical protein